MSETAIDLNEAGRLIDMALAAATKGDLTRQHLVSINDEIKAAVAAGATQRWLVEAHSRMSLVLDARLMASRSAAGDADPVGRRRASRITSPSLGVQLEDYTSPTIDWSAYGILVSDPCSYICVGDLVTVVVSCGLVEGGGAVSGRVVWRDNSGRIAIEFIVPSVAVQTIKIRLLRAGLLNRTPLGIRDTGDERRDTHFD